MRLLIAAPILLLIGCQQPPTQAEAIAKAEREIANIQADLIRREADCRAKYLQNTTLGDACLQAYQVRAGHAQDALARYLTLIDTLQASP